MRLRMMLHWMHLTIVVMLSILTPVIRCEQMVEVAGGCHAVPGLSRSQRRLCTKSPSAAAAALEGLKTAVKECQHQLRWHRWNCSSLVPKRLNPHSSAMLQRGYRETAFAYAITAAGVAHSVARACAQGNLLACGCDPVNFKSSGTEMPKDAILELPPGAKTSPEASYRWKWGGCSHNMDYGIAFSKLFLDSREKAVDLHSRVNLHNNDVGRQAVADKMEVRCKCHGTSGSCQLRTCWKATPDFRTIGKELKNHYRNALMVGQSNVNNSPPKISKHRNKRKWGGKRKENWKTWKQPKNFLLFYENSPDYCERDQFLDIAGTAGRRCARARIAPARGSCSSLCCGRGHDLLRTHRSERCRCRFQWCCKVECDICEREEWVAVCK